MDRQQPSISIAFRFVRFILNLISHPFIKKVGGEQNLKREGPFIIAANHASHIDWLFFLGRFTFITNRYVHFFATSEHYRNPFFRYLVQLAQGIWVEKGVAEARSLLIALKYLKKGRILGIFPEGRRSRDGKILQGMRGVAYLVLLAKVPVIPVGLVNTHKVLPFGAAFIRPARCAANIGEALMFDGFYDDFDEAMNKNDRERIKDIEEQIVEIIMKNIARLSGQVYPYSSK